MTDLNPYAAPQADCAPLADKAPIHAPEEPATGGVWRDGALLVLRRDVRLPDICVKTNAPAEHRLTYDLSWHPPALYLAFLFPPALLIAPFFIYQARVEVPVSDFVYRRKHRDQWLIAGCLLLGLLAIVAPPLWGLHLPAWTVVVALVLLIASIGYLQDTSFLGARKIDAGRVWIAGASPEYLARWPDLPRP